MQGLHRLTDELMEESSPVKERKAEERHVPEGQLVYRAVRQDGDYALGSPSGVLVWGGVAAGVSMGFSLVAEGLLQAHLPDAPWTPLVARLGYAAGFLLVILGRQQLFTEQTLTAVLPLLSRDRPAGTVRNVARVWGVVLAANLVGSAVFAAAAAWTPTFPPNVHQAFSHIGHAALSHDFLTTTVRGIYAGFLVAMMVWLLPAAGSARFWIVLILAYLVGLGGFSHIIAGTTNALYVVFRGERAFFEYVYGFLVPTLIGNSAGGVAIVAALGHAQYAPPESR